MPRRIVSIVAVLLAALTAGSLVGPSSLGLSAAQEGSPVATPTSCPATSEEENAAVVRRLFAEGWGQGHLQVLDEVLADDVIVHRAPATAGSIPPTAFATPGPVAYAEGIQVLRSDFPDLRVTIEDVIAAGDRVAMRTTFAGTQADPIENLGAPNTGRLHGAGGVGVRAGGLRPGGRGVGAGRQPDDVAPAGDHQRRGAARRRHPDRGHPGPVTDRVAPGPGSGDRLGC